MGNPAEVKTVPTVHVNEDFHFVSGAFIEVVFQTGTAVFRVAETPLGGLSVEEQSRRGSPSRTQVENLIVVFPSARLNGGGNVARFEIKPPVPNS